MSSSTTNITGVSEASHVSYILGKHNWRIEMDKWCNKSKNYTRQLKLTSCYDGEFTCDDGQCVRMEQRCDQLSDCRDESDEDNCQLLVVKGNYNKRVPPITTRTGRVVVPVKVSITLFKVVSIVERKSSIDFQFEIILEWKENRATYQNLKTKTSLNFLSDEDIKRLWLPLVTYSNTDDKMSTRRSLGMDYCCQCSERRRLNKEWSGRSG